MEITVEEREKIKSFFAYCNEMIDGRFILSDTKVSNILKSIVKSEVLYDLYSKCMNGFKFAYVMERSRADNLNNGGYFNMPTDNSEVVAFVTCLLLEVDKKNINLQSFVTDNFFSADGYNISYNNFAITILVAYKTAIKNLLEIDEDGNSTYTESGIDDNQVTMEEVTNTIETDQDTKILFANLLMNINELQNAINEDYRLKYTDKEELIIILKALNRAIQLEELLIINALLVHLEHTVTKSRKFKLIFENIKLLIADIYY